jgi:hypothetical protein
MSRAEITVLKVLALLAGALLVAQLVQLGLALLR